LFGKTPLKTQNDYIFQKFGGGHGPFRPSLATPMISSVNHLKNVGWAGTCSQRWATATLLIASASLLQLVKFNKKN